MKSNNILGNGIHIICMDDQCHKFYLSVNLTGLKKHLNFKTGS